MSSSRALARAGLIVSGAFLLSRVLGWLRVVIIGNTFAAGPELDAFLAAFRLPDLMFQLVAAGALSSAVIPIVTGLLANGEVSRAWRVVSTIANMMLAALLVLGLVVLVAAPAIIAAINPGFDPAKVNRTVDLTRIMVLSPIFLSLGSLVTSVLNARGRFAASAIAPIVYNLAIIGAALVLTPSFGVTGLAIGVVAGAILHLVVQLAPLRAQGFRYDAADRARRSRDAHGTQTDGATGARARCRADHVRRPQLDRIDLRGLARSRCSTSRSPCSRSRSESSASRSAWSSCRPCRATRPSGGTRSSPISCRGRSASFCTSCCRSRGSRSSWGTRSSMCSSASAKRVGGDLDLTAATLATLLLGLTAHALIAILARAFYARQDTKTPVAAAVLAVVINSSLAGVLAGRFGLPGLGLAIAIAAWVETIVLLVLLQRSLPELAFRPLLSLGIRSIVVAIAGSLAALGVLEGLRLALGDDPDRIGLVVRMTIVGVVWLLTSAVASLVLRIGELPSIIGLMLDLIRRPRPA